MPSGIPAITTHLTEGTGESDTSFEPKKPHKKVLSLTQLRLMASELAEEYYTDAKSARPRPNAAPRKWAGVGFGVMFDKLTQKVNPEAREDAPSSSEALDRLITKLEQVGRVAASDNK